MKKNLLFIAIISLIAASCVKDRNPPAAVVLPPVSTNGDTLIYYWNFNGDSLHALNPTTAILSGAGMTYAGGAGIADAPYDTVAPGTTINGVGADSISTGASGASLRLRDPATGPLTITLPTTGYKNIVLKYAVEHTSKGASTNTVTYTVDGTNYINTAIASTSTYTIDSLDTNNGFQAVSFDFSSDSLVNNNPNFKVQINFAGGTGYTTTSGNDRFDNVTLYGVKQ